MKRKTQKALAGFAAVCAVMYGVALLWGLGSIAWTLTGSGSGGIGAVSAGLFEGVVPLAVGAVLNRVLAGWEQ